MVVSKRSQAQAAADRRYGRSDKGKERNRRWRESPKGREVTQAIRQRNLEMKRDLRQWERQKDGIPEHRELQAQLSAWKAQGLISHGVDLRGTYEELKKFWLTLQAQDLALESVPFDGVLAGVDATGRDCWLGPIVAASVVVPPAVVGDLQSLGLLRARRASESRREKLDTAIRDRCAVTLGLVSAKEVDAMPLDDAVLLAMQRSLENVEADLCIINGNAEIPDIELDQETGAKRESVEVAIAAARIIAKAHHAKLMRKLGEEYPEYGIENHKGYGRPAHRKSLIEFGATPHHRQSFDPVQKLPRKTNKE